MGKTAVVNKGKGKRKRKRKNPQTMGAAANPRRKKRRRRSNPSPYKSAGYYRRPNPTRNPSALDMETWTSVLPAAVAGIWACRWAVKMAGPFEADAQGRPVPGIKHAIAGAIAIDIGGRVAGQVLGSRRESDIAQIAGIGYLGDLFLRTRVLNNSTWVQNNISLEGVDASARRTLGTDAFTDAAGNRYVRTAAGWQLAGWNYNAGMGQAGRIQLPANAKAGDVIRLPDGRMFVLQANRTLRGLTDSERARVMEAPTRTLPGGSDASDMRGLQRTSALGDFMDQTPLGRSRTRRRRNASTTSTFGYAVG